MKNKAKSKSAAVPRVDPYIDGLMSKLLERLVSLEAKMDKVLAHTTSAPAAGNGHAPKSQPQPSQPPASQPPRRDRVMYEAICADCSKVCEVPFKPSEDRAVYCKECFSRRKSGGNGGGHGMPKLTPVALPPRPQQKVWPAMTPAAQAVAKSSSKKTKKKKR